MNHLAHDFLRVSSNHILSISKYVFRSCGAFIDWTVKIELCRTDRLGLLHESRWVKQRLETARGSAWLDLARSEVAARLRSARNVRGNSRLGSGRNDLLKNGSIRFGDLFLLRSTDGPIRFSWKRT